MAELSEFTANMDVVRAGTWITVGQAPNTFEIKTRGITSAYRDGLNRLKREAAREANRSVRPGEAPFDPDRLPPSLDDRCQGRALAENCFIDVRGLTKGGEPVTAEQFAAMLIDPEGKTLLLSYAIGAAHRVAEQAKQEQDTALGNSLPASASA